MKSLPRLWAFWRFAQLANRRLPAIGRAFFALAIVAFGAQLLVHGRFLDGLFPAQSWTPAAPPAADILGLFFVADGIALFVPRPAQRAAFALAGVIAVCLVLMNAAQITTVITNATARTRFFEPLAIAGAALVLGASLGGDAQRNYALDRAGRLLFAFSLVIFGMQQVVYAEVCFIVAGIAIAANVFARLAAGCLGFIFLAWVVLHAARVAAAPANYAQLAGLVVALAMCGGGWLLMTPKRRP